MPFFYFTICGNISIEQPSNLFGTVLSPLMNSTTVDCCYFENIHGISKLDQGLNNYVLRLSQTLVSKNQDEFLRSRRVPYSSR